MDVLSYLDRAWQYVAAVLTVFLALVASAHAVLHKRDSRAAVLWVGFIWLVPVLGPLLYTLMGVNRIRRKAALLRGGLERFHATSPDTTCVPRAIAERMSEGGHLASLAHLVENVVARPLTIGNRIDPLRNGDETYPAMLEAIASAQRSVTLCTYIFDNDVVGRAFAETLGQAVRRGVEVRVLIDATGTRYSWPPILSVLRQHGVRYARFLPAFPLWRLFSLNLRNHRKILVVDGRTGFTGGMNLRAGHRLRDRPRGPVQDIHFRVEGPVVAQLQEAFADDWKFTTGEALRSEAWFPPLEPRGSVVARGVVDGPDEDFEKLRLTLLGAVAIARRSVRIMTPYFLPDPSLVSALNVAALRGVAVEIALPSKCNLPFVHWASRAQWWQILKRGCRIWLTPPPFDHSKLMIVDDFWSFIGSANWDPRSLRLNFEFNVECYDQDFAGALNRIFDEKLQNARPVTLQDVDGRSLPLKLRDGVARLLTPFL
jgi:cardiolipin synthase